MKEYQRQMITEWILKDIQEMASIKLLSAMIAELEIVPTVRRYLDLIYEKNVLEKKYEYYDSDVKLINRGFDRAMAEEFKCEHGIWFYCGSNYLSIVFLSEHDHTIVKDFEDYPTEKGKFEFLYNEYICLECGRVSRIEKRDIKNFEKSNLVFRSKKSNWRKDAEYYRNLLYQSLYCNSFDEAVKIVADTFNDNETNNKVRMLHK